jgi:bifunctional DNA-binding transcriptional regulator/antitoxin component of YhaV-PrlF toxin-antitoxin module
MTKPAEHAATVSSKGQVVIPSDVRRKLGLSRVRCCVSWSTVTACA